MYLLQFLAERISNKIPTPCSSEYRDIDEEEYSDIGSTYCYRATESGLMVGVYKLHIACTCIFYVLVHRV